MEDNKGLIYKFNSCKIHEHKPLEYICLNKECPSKNAIECSECALKNKVHHNHSDDFITFYNKDYFEK